VYVNIYIILDDYVTARRNLPLAELTSDFPSECEEKIVGKRQHKKNKKYFTESSDSQEENSIKLKKCVSKITKKNICNSNRKLSSSSNLSEDEENDSCTVKESNNSKLPIPQKLQQKSKQILNTISSQQSTKSSVICSLSPVYKNQNQHNKGNFLFFIIL